MRNHEAIIEVSHVATDSCPVLALRRKSGKRRQAAARRAESRSYGATSEHGRVRIPVVAIVDDDESFRQALERFMGTFAFRVRTYASGEEFLGSSELALVGCLLLDLAMPGMSGLEVMQQLGALAQEIGGLTQRSAARSRRSDAPAAGRAESDDPTGSKRCATWQTGVGR